MLDFNLTKPFCLIQMEDKSDVLLVEGEALKLNQLSELPISEKSRHDEGHLVYDSISMIPFSQIRERGFVAHNNDEKISSIKIHQALKVSIKEILEILPDEQIEIESGLSYDYTEEKYAEIIRQIVDVEIGGGEGSSFVTPRKCSGTIKEFSLNKALSIFKRLVAFEYGCYWKFLFFDGDTFFIGATPERHLTVESEKIKMNPISGTFRKKESYSDPEEMKKDLLVFLSDEKEIDELFMVVDEELKMMSKMCSDGGTIIGPLLKEMSHLIHTEYLLMGTGCQGVIELFKNSMFAPTVIGSPMGNACKVLYNYEKGTRSYYSSAIVMLGRSHTGEPFLDSAITIRTQEILANGEFSIRVGATLVKDSIPEKEVKETDAKLKGSINSLIKNDFVKRPGYLPMLEKDEEVQTKLFERNQNLSKFWLLHQNKKKLKDPKVLGKRFLIINNEDDFVYMLRHMLQCLGAEVHVVSFESFADWQLGEQDLVILGPGPGDPTTNTPKMQKVLQIIHNLIKSEKKFLSICLGLQLLSRYLGFDLVRKEKPLQGVQKEILLYGKKEKVGFYNAFYAEFSKKAKQKLEEISLDKSTKEIYAYKTTNFSAFQFHPESILTQNGFDIVKQSILELLE